MQSTRCFTNEEIKKTLKEIKISKGPSMLKSDTDNFDINKFYLNPINQKLPSNNQWNAIPRYEYNNKYNKKSGRYGNEFVLGTGAIKLTHGGIPKISIFNPSDNSRCFFWLYLDKIQKSSEKLFNMFEKIDDYFEKEINDKQNANGIIKISNNGIIQNYKIPLQQKFIYNHIIKTRDYDDDDDYDSNNIKNKYLNDLQKFKKRLRIKFSTVYDSEWTSDKPKKINTHLFVQNSKNPLPLVTATEIEKFFKLNSTSHFVIMLDKFWICKKCKQFGKDKMVECGFTLKCLQIVLVNKPYGYIIPLEDIMTNEDEDVDEDVNIITSPFDIKHDNDKNGKLTIYI
jgi:hypothetical protein